MLQVQVQDGGVPVVLPVFGPQQSIAGLHTAGQPRLVPDTPRLFGVLHMPRTWRLDATLLPLPTTTWSSCCIVLPLTTKLPLPETLLTQTSAPLFPTRKVPKKYESVVVQDASIELFATRSVEFASTTIFAAQRLTSWQSPTSNPVISLLAMTKTEYSSTASHNKPKVM